jgi:hypothetical protein
MATADSASDGLAEDSRTLWQVLSGHGLQRFSTGEEISRRQRLVERGLEQVCSGIAGVVSDSNAPAILRVRDLRSKALDGGKSLYECLNQLIHYWYCCSAALHLVSCGYTDIRMRPTGAENVDGDRGAYDLEAFHPSEAPVIAEVFCVSRSLWEKKKSGSIKKLAASATGVLRSIYYNEECKPALKARIPGFRFYGVTAHSGNVRLICDTNPTSAYLQPA